MKPRGLSGRLAHLSARNPWRIVVLWVFLLIAGISASTFLPADFSTEATFTNQPEAIRAEDLLLERMEGDASPDELVIVRSDTYTVDQPEFQALVERITTDVTALDGTVVEATNYYHSGQEWLVSDDRSATIIPVFLVDLENADPFLHLVEEEDGQAGFTVVTGGQASIDQAFVETSESDLLTGEMIGVSVAMLVLVIVFGTLVAAGIPLSLAIISIVIGVGITMLVGQQFELSFFALNFIVMMGLAVGIDYVLFILGRYREERTNGLGIDQAIIKAGNTSSKAVLFSGLTVVTALLGMLLVPSNIFQSLGLAAIIVVLVSVVATLTLLPAILKLLGDRVERGRGRALMIVIGLALLLFAAMFQGIGVDLVFSIAYVVLAIGAFVLAALNIDPFHLRQNSTRDGFWDRMTRFVLARPLPLFAATTAVLIAITSIYFTINTGQSGISTMPRDTSAYRAFTILGQQFSGISLEEPHEIVIDTPDANTPEVQAAIASLTGQLGNDADFGQTTVRVNEAGDLAAISVAATGDTQSAAALESIDRLRDEYIPAAFAGVNAEVLVTGPTAFTVDFNAVVAEYTPIVFTFVLGISILVLLLAFRSIVVPIKSVIMNLLSVGASYGLLVAVFQHGWGNELLGFRQVEQIDAWVPLMMFTVLFGLSMDYQVFLLSRIKERYDLTRDNTDAVSYGLRSTASIITGAALIMVAVFGGFAMGELSMFQQMGFGLATAVILDATIIRSVLVPSGMKLLGDWNWYFPNWLGWLPKINVEGVSEDEPAFAPEATVAD